MFLQIDRSFIVHDKQAFDMTKMALCQNGRVNPMRRESLITGSLGSMHSGQSMSKTQCKRLGMGRGFSLQPFVVGIFFLFCLQPLATNLLRAQPTPAIISMYSRP